MKRFRAWAESWGEFGFNTLLFLFVLGITALLFGFIVWLGQCWYESLHPTHVPCRDAVITVGQNSAAITCPHAEHVLVTDLSSSALCRCQKP